MTAASANEKAAPSDASAKELEAIRGSALYNEDLAPTKPEQRRWGAYEFAALWIGMAICIPSYMLASSLIAGGMSWKQAIFTIFLGNMIVLVPMLLNSHAGAQYGIPFPVFARSAFGVLGANVPSVARALVACGWFGIQTWIGGQAIHTILLSMWSGWKNVPAGIWICFFAFWAMNMYVVIRGTESIRILEDYGAPFLIVISLALLAWAYMKAGGFGPMFSSPGKFATFREFLPFFVVSLTGMVGFWSTLALNICDFTRYAKSQRAHAVGQSLGLPLTMTLYSFIGIAVTSMTVAIFGEAIWDPVALAGKLDSPLAVAIALAGVVVATLTTNVAANVVSPANAFSNAWPRGISFRTGGIITGILGVAMMPWKLLANYETYLYTWLVGYSGFLGPIAGILICDYYLLRKKQLSLIDLYQRGGEYEFSRGVNWNGLAALAAGCGAAFLGLIYEPMRALYSYAWFVGFAVGFSAYYALMTIRLPETEQAQ
ncbi:MAG TPA: NCS1 family nucleobase:cation symporter-1 [Candidatus Acidoferrales bacterium]|nr:NCS1 family nucleobase:cation symporter-1 [Candidatus Acidoferrales bacterium]